MDPRAPMPSPARRTARFTTGRRPTTARTTGGGGNEDGDDFDRVTVAAAASSLALSSSSSTPSSSPWRQQQQRHQRQIVVAPPTPPPHLRHRDRDAIATMLSLSTTAATRRNRRDPPTTTTSSTSTTTSSSLATAPTAIRQRRRNVHHHHHRSDPPPSLRGDGRGRGAASSDDDSDDQDHGSDDDNMEGSSLAFHEDHDSDDDDNEYDDDDNDNATELEDGNTNHEDDPDTMETIPLWGGVNSTTLATTSTSTTTPAAAAAVAGGTTNPAVPAWYLQQQEQSTTMMWNAIQQQQAAAAAAAWRERERRQRTVRVLMMFLLMLLLMDSDNNNNNNTTGPHQNAELKQRQQQQQQLRHGVRQRNSVNNLNQLISNPHTTPVVLPLQTFLSRQAQDLRLRNIVTNHPRYHILRKHNDGANYELAAYQHARERAELHRDQFAAAAAAAAADATTTMTESSSTMTTLDYWSILTNNNKKKNHHNDNNAPNKAHPVAAAAGELMIDDPVAEQKVVWHYPWNVTGFYRGAWSRQNNDNEEEDHDNDDDDEDNDDGAAAAKYRKKKQQEEDEMERNILSSAASADRVNATEQQPLNILVHAADIESIMIQRLRRQQRRLEQQQQQQQQGGPFVAAVGLVSLPVGMQLRLRDDHNLTRLYYDDIQLDSSGRPVATVVPPGTSTTMPIMTATATTMRLVGGSTSYNNRVRDATTGKSTTTTANMGTTSTGMKVATASGGNPSHTTTTTSTTPPEVTLTQDSGRVAFQLFVRNIPAMTELSIVDGFVKLYDSSSPGYSTRNDLLLRVRGVLIHNLGRLCLISTNSVGGSGGSVARSALVLDDGTLTAVTTGTTATTTAAATISSVTTTTTTASTTNAQQQPQVSASWNHRQASSTTSRTTRDPLALQFHHYAQYRPQQQQHDDHDHHRRLLVEPALMEKDHVQAAIRDAVVALYPPAVAAEEGTAASVAVGSNKRGWSLVSEDWYNEMVLESAGSSNHPEEPAPATANGVGASSSSSSSSLFSSDKHERYRSTGAVVDGTMQQPQIREEKEAREKESEEEEELPHPFVLDGESEHSPQQRRRRTKELPDSASGNEDEGDGAASSSSSSYFQGDMPPVGWSDIVIPYPYAQDDARESLRRARTPAARVMPSREQLLETNAAECSFEITMDVQEVEWTVGAWRTMYNRLLDEAKRLNPQREEGEAADHQHQSDETVSSSTSSSPGISASASSSRGGRTRPDQALAMHMAGVIYSPNCHFKASLNATALRTDWDATTTKAINYSFYMMLVCLTQILILLRQLLHSQGQSAATRVSLVCIGWQTVIDALLCLGHIYLSLAIQPLFTAFASVSFFKLLIFCVIEMKYMATIIQARNSSHGGQSIEVLRRQVAMLHLRFYVALFATFLMMYYVSDTHRVYFMLALYSFWVPQIIMNMITEAKNALHPHYIYGMSLTRLVAPCYILAVRNNFLREVYPESPYDPYTCQALIVWVAIQTALLVAQAKYGARFMIPARFLPPKFDYSRPIPDSMLPPGAAAMMMRNESCRHTSTSAAAAASAERDRSEVISTGCVGNSVIRASLPAAAASHHCRGTTTVVRESSPSHRPTSSTTRNRGRGSRRSEASSVMLLTEEQAPPMMAIASPLEPSSSSSSSSESTCALECGGSGTAASSSAHHALECSICYESIDWQRRKEYMLAPCNHIFHRTCLVQWMDVKMECPICRTELPSL